MVQNNTVFSGNVPKWGHYPVYSQGVIQKPLDSSFSGFLESPGPHAADRRSLAGHWEVPEAFCGYIMGGDFGDYSAQGTWKKRPNMKGLGLVMSNQQAASRGIPGEKGWAWCFVFGLFLRGPLF